MVTVPIPQRKPSQNTSFSFDAIGDLLTGTFNKGLDVLSGQLQHKQSLELLQLQLQAERQASDANLTGQPNGNVISPVSAPFLAGVSPITLAILGVAAVVLIKK